MHTSAGLKDLHARTHQSLRKLLDHCAAFSEDALSLELEGFGYPSIRLQLHHLIGAELYWIGVLRGLMLAEEDEADFATMDTLRSFHGRVVTATTEYLDAASETELNTRRKMTTWSGEADLTPAHVLLRTQTHVYQHQGQIAAMSRLLGRPIPPGLDFPLA